MTGHPIIGDPGIGDGQDFGAVGRRIARPITTRASHVGRGETATSADPLT
jgi:hypothetical protein